MRSPLAADEAGHQNARSKAGHHDARSKEKRSYTDAKRRKTSSCMSRANWDSHLDHNSLTLVGTGPADTFRLHHPYDTKTYIHGAPRCESWEHCLLGNFRLLSCCACGDIP